MQSVGSKWSQSLIHKSIQMNIAGMVNLQVLWLVSLALIECFTQNTLNLILSNLSKLSNKRKGYSYE